MQWRDVRDLGIGLFKKRSRSRTLWVGGTGTIFGIFAFLLLLTGVSETHSGDSYCVFNEITGLDKCEAFVNITSTYWRICFEDNFEFVSTNPNIETELYVPTYGKKWREFIPGKDCINRRKINKFKIVGYKNPKQTVKWTVNFDKAYIPEVDIDPIWFGIEVTEIQSCITKQRTVKDMGMCTIEYNSTYINNKTKINITTIHFNNYTCQIGTHIEYYEICEEIGWQIGDKEMLCPNNHRCDKIGNKICILDCDDGDCNYNAKYVNDNSWTSRCFDIRDMPTGDFKINSYKKPVLTIK